MTPTAEKFNLLWCTDLHLNFVHEKGIQSLCRKMMSATPNAIVVTGDIAEAPTIVEYLGLLALHTEKICPIFFILGNHDYYDGTIENVRHTMEKLFTYNKTHKHNFVPRLGWLSSSGVVSLTEKTALVGHDGWYDGQYADWYKSRVSMGDYVVIGELSEKACPLRKLRFDKINELAKQSSAYVHEQIMEAFTTHEHVFVATHVPPFRENSVYEGKISDDHWMPHFSSKHMGDMLLSIAIQFPQKKITVLCGHSHGHADNMILSNLRCITGKAKYRHPQINQVFEIE